jgi:hypothetical protein
MSAEITTLLFLLSAISKSFLTIELLVFCARAAYESEDLLAISSGEHFVRAGFVRKVGVRIAWRAV